MHLDPEISIFSPIATPTIPPNPILLSITSHSESNQTHNMICQKRESPLGKHSSTVLCKVFCNIHRTCNRTSVVNFLFNIIRVLDGAIVLCLVKPSRSNCIAFAIFTRRGTVFTNLYITAVEVLGVFRDVSLTSLVWDSVLVCKFSNSTCISTFTCPTSIAVY